jgi:oxygen-independent coproporphyrinogen-3 oxidase
VPDEELTADLYEMACEQLNAAGIRQYEISNFAREGFESRHNLKYWTRQPYLGFGVDAHSMLPSAGGVVEAVRFSTSDSLEQFVDGAPLNRTDLSREMALEETFFLALRLNRGVDVIRVREDFGERAIERVSLILSELEEADLLVWEAGRVRLTSRGRLLSNGVFERVLGCAAGSALRQ